jgi:hypothetical protein
MPVMAKGVQASDNSTMKKVAIGAGILALLALLLRRK